MQFSGASTFSRLLKTVFLHTTKLTNYLHIPKRCSFYLLCHYTAYLLISSSYAALSLHCDIFIILNRFLYISDWGSRAKVIRTDLDGQSPFVLPIDVENPNGITLKDFDLFVVDSHLKSAFIEPNGTVIYEKPPTLVSYQTRFVNTTVINMIDMEVG